MGAARAPRRGPPQDDRVFPRDRGPRDLRSLRAPLGEGLIPGPPHQLVLGFLSGNPTVERPFRLPCPHSWGHSSSAPNTGHSGTSVWPCECRRQATVPSVKATLTTPGGNWTDAVVTITIPDKLESTEFQPVRQTYFPRFAW